jgi:hypothetical protein
MQSNFYPLMVPSEFLAYGTFENQNYCGNISNYEIFKNLEV